MIFLRKSYILSVSYYYYSHLDSLNKNNKNIFIKNS